jgi:hypothetical protein
MIKATCDAECKQEFVIHDLQLAVLDGGVEKTFFTCPHCQHEYVAFYTDAEIRDLQEKIRKVQRRYANSKCNVKAAIKQESKLKQQIKVKMDALRARIEGLT